MYEHHLWQPQEDTPGLASQAQGTLKCCYHSAGQTDSCSHLPLWPSQGPLKLPHYASPTSQDGPSHLISTEAGTMRGDQGKAEVKQRKLGPRPVEATGKPTEGKAGDSGGSREDSESGFKK